MNSIDSSTGLGGVLTRIIYVVYLAGYTYIRLAQTKEHAMPIQDAI